MGSSSFTSPESHTSSVGGLAIPDRAEVGMKGLSWACEQNSAPASAGTLGPVRITGTAPSSQSGSETASSPSSLHPVGLGRLRVAFRNKHSSRDLNTPPFTGSLC